MEIKVLDHGFVRLVDHMPRENLDNSIVQAARVSYGDGTKTSRGDTGLLRYLLRHWHTTPFEMVEFKFHIKMPIYIARQHLRHRTASVNEMSARYSIVPKEYYEPSELRGQSEINHQGSEGVVDIDQNGMHSHLENSFDIYEKLLEDGCCREQARGIFLNRRTQSSIGRLTFIISCIISTFEWIPMHRKRFRITHELSMIS